MAIPCKVLSFLCYNARMALLFDRSDRNLLSHIELSQSTTAHLFNYHLHPRGIKELVNQQSIRVANLLRNLLDTLEIGRENERIEALHSLRDEVYFSSRGSMNKNSARVLLSIMKDLLREAKDGNERRALELAHDFHSALGGNPLTIRRFLRRYHLLEMPEEWNQLTFDHHVHDAHTKGRKSPSHLIMDAWIKGIRKLTVIYYEFVPLEAARELLEAARIMQIEIRIGVEFLTRFRERTASLIWSPRGFADDGDFLSFLERKNVRAFMEEGRGRMEERSASVLKAFHRFNKERIEKLNSDYNLSLEGFSEEELFEFVGTGQLSFLHLSEFIHQKIFPLLEARIEELRREYRSIDSRGKRAEEIEDEVSHLNDLTPETVFEVCFREVSPLRKNNSLITPKELIERLSELHPGYRVTLNLSGLDLNDVFEIIHRSGGRISHIETFNQKDYAKGLQTEIPEIKEFQAALNDGNTVKLKRIIRSMITSLREEKTPESDARADRFEEYLQEMPSLVSWYRSRKLRDRWGSDSTGRFNNLFGMGFAIVDTLPKNARREINRWERLNARIMPIHVDVTLIKRYVPSRFWKALRRLSGRMSRGVTSERYGTRSEREWISESVSRNFSEYKNVVTLGGRSAVNGNGFILDDSPERRNTVRSYWSYLNSDVKNFLKVLIGFIPAFLTFYLTKEWWVLAYLGAPIWFGITGLRNVLQSVIGGDGFRRSPLLSWKDYVNWGRVSDSLLYTGFSVPLLDFLVKRLILDQSFNITASTNVLALYTFMGLVNGVYISTHNFFRGLPRTAILGNFFRSILSIPVAVGLNDLIGVVLTAVGVTGVAGILQKWAAVISKAASDTVAGIIEGTADRNRNIRMRMLDYDRKLDQIYTSYSRLELLLPEEEVLTLMRSPKKIVKMIGVEDEELLKTIIYDALDLLYFWMYQPHARTVLRRIIRTLPSEDRIIFLHFQNVLLRRKLITSLFVDGLLGKRFEYALAFYLSRFKAYLKALERIV